MAVFSRQCVFIEQNTELLVGVTPGGIDLDEFDSEVKKCLVKDITTDARKKKLYVPIELTEDVEIKFSLQSSGKVTKEACSSPVSTPLLPGRSFSSLNQVAEEISRCLEKQRISHSNKIYECIYFKSGNIWKLLRSLRDEIYSNYEDEFEEYKSILNESVSSPQPSILSMEQQSTLDFEERIRTLIQDSQLKDKQIKEIEDLLEHSKLNYYHRKIEEFKDRLKQDYPETQGSDSWQKWIFKNSWLFGIKYGKPIEHPQVGFRSTLDYLFPTHDGFVDILEIKKTSFEVIQEDRSHPGAYRWSGQVNQAIGQSVNYLNEIDEYRDKIADNIKKEYGLELITVKPRALILIGKSDDWDKWKKQAFRHLNHSLHGIQVLTYTELLIRAENLIKIYGN